MLKKIEIVLKNGALMLRPARVHIRQETDELQWVCAFDEDAAVHFKGSRPFREKDFGVNGGKTGTAEHYMRNHAEYEVEAKGQTCHGIVLVSKEPLGRKPIEISLNPLRAEANTHVRQLGDELMWRCHDDPEARVIFEKTGAFEKNEFGMDEPTDAAIGEIGESFKYRIESKGEILDPQIIIDPPPDDDGRP
jgi:hypothetical protein